MRTLLVIVFFVCGCAPVSPVEVLAIRPMSLGLNGTDCELPMGNAAISTGGSIDAASRRPQMVINLNFIANNFGGGSPVVRSGEAIPLSAGGRDNPLMEEIVMTYTSKPSIGAIPVYSRPTSGVFAKANDSLSLVVALLSDQAIERINALSASQNPSEVLTTLTVNIEGRGRLSSTGVRWATPPISFPIRIRKSDLSCVDNKFQADGCQQSGTSYSIDFAKEATCCASGVNCVISPP